MAAVPVTIATSFASALLDAVADKVIDALTKLPLFGDLETQLGNLQHELIKLKAYLCCAESLNPQGNNDLVLAWLRRVKKAAFFAENLLDDICYDQIQRQVENTRSRLAGGRPFKHICSSAASYVFRGRITDQVRTFMSMTDEIKKEAAEIGLRPVDFVANAPSYGDLREVRENVDTLDVIGRQLDEDLIVQELIHPNTNEVLPVVAIVGMSGVGKTTLARKVYDNERVKGHFDKKIWIFVSDNFDLKRILDEMLQSVTGRKSDLSNINTMEEKLQLHLAQERCLLVLDDVWNTDRQVWDSLRTSLVRITCSGGSRVLLTTQSDEVASTVDACFSHNLKGLEDNNAWELFSKNAFANKTQEQISDLEDIGRRIIRKCGGLPLALKLVGYLLRSKDKRSQWDSVEKSELWSLPVGQTDIMPWLLISFYHLPNATVKQCFAHCSVVFQKGEDTSESSLIQAWIAQGFIQPLKTNEIGIDNPGERCIKALLANGLLQRGNYDHGMLWMHDLVYDLARYLSKDTTHITTCLSVAPETEHIVCHGEYNLKRQVKFSDNVKLAQLRTLVCYYNTISTDFVSHQAPFLRHLALIDCPDLTELPSSIGRLKHLRLLDLTGASIEYLPESIGSLYHLQALNIEHCDRLKELPQQITKLVNLRHIYATTVVKGMGQLTWLMALPEVNMKANEGWKLKELQSMTLLRGSLKLTGLEHINCKEDAVVASLDTKAGIEDLQLNWTSNQGQEGNTVSNDKDVIDGLQPHPNLVSLKLSNFRGNRFSNWLSEQSSFLKRISLTCCNKCEQLPALGQLRFLEEIEIAGMASIEVIGINFFYINDDRVAASSCGNNDRSKRILFPQLKKLVLMSMPKLKDWFGPSGSCDIAFPCLEVLVIQYCPLLASAPTCFQSLKQLKMTGVNSGKALMMVLGGSNSLTSLTIEYIPQLTSLSQELLKCTYLRQLRIIGCKELTELPPTIQSLCALEELRAKHCDRLTSIPSIDGLSSLRDLIILKCGKLTQTPSGLERCVSIETLHIMRCNKLNLIPDLKRLSCLKSLKLTHFSKQMSVPGWLSQLSNLQELSTGGFNKELDEFRGIDHLPKSLTRLDLVGWPKLKSIPNEVKIFTQLVSLTLFKFDEVEALPEWLSNLSSLEYLSIGCCKNLKYLPSSDAMRRLTKLRTLRITVCPELWRRLRRVDGENGKERRKIPHTSISLFTSPYAMLSPELVFSQAYPTISHFQGFEITVRLPSMRTI